MPRHSESSGTFGATRTVISLDSASKLVVSSFRASPSAVCAASIGVGVARSRGVGVAGHLTYDSAREPVDRATVYDLASVTKPMVALAFARLERRGLIMRSEPLGDVVPWLRRTLSGSVPLDLLFSHRAGLEAHVKLFAPLLVGEKVDREQSLDTAARARREGCAGDAPADGFPPVYSDLGYLLVGAAMEARTGSALDAIVADELLAPLGLADRIGSARRLRSATPTFDANVAPTESIAFRGGVLQGVVHDENAFALSGDGLSGHAGLFGDAEAVLAVGEAVLDGVRGAASLFTPDELEPLVRTRAGGTLLAGFDRKSGEIPAAGTRVGPRTFGHLGFTGTSLWIDPDTGFVGVLLTNRVHPTRDHIAIRAARPTTYDAMFDALALAA